MFRLYYCIQNEHDQRLVLLAGLICIAASIAVVVLLRQARDADRGDARRWLAAAGTASGFGIWATHFIAMIGYDPGVIKGYALMPTAASLLVAIAATSAGFWLALKSPLMMSRLVAGAVVGLGVAAMHYLGMQAVQVFGRFSWSVSYVIASIVFAILPMVPAISLTVDRRGSKTAIAAASLIALGILLLHFTGMAGIRIIPDRLDEPQAILLSSLGLGVSVGAVAFGALGFGMFAALVSGRARTAIAASEREFRLLVQGISDCAIYMLDKDGRVASWNAGAQRLKGYLRDEAIGLELATFYTVEDQAADGPARALDTARREGKFRAEGWRVRKDGGRFWANVTIEAVYDEHGAFHGYAKISRDMTVSKQDQDRLQTLTNNLDAALSNMHQGLCLFGSDERLIVSNERVGAIFGVEASDCPPGTLFEDVFRKGLERRASGPVPANVLNEVMARHRECLTQPTGGTLIVPFTDSCTLSIAHRPMPDGGWVTTFDDITERRRAEMRIEHMALHDGLTGLPNRLNFNERLDR
ncbi:MAG TPA: MHYT domain-containing protein, partial [Sphingobium sp.]|nr:MHYT domain-containing protein [Sphingobium sp.]